MANKIIHFFDRLEDKMRAKLSRYPILYAFIGGIGVVLFWRGVWHTADFLIEILLKTSEVTTLGLIDGPLSLIVGSILLLITGIFVSAFVGNRLIISGLSGEKKLAEKAESEIETEEAQIKKIQSTLERVEKEITKIESELEKK